MAKGVVELPNHNRNIPTKIINRECCNYLRDLQVHGEVGDSDWSEISVPNTLSDFSTFYIPKFYPEGPLRDFQVFDFYPGIWIRFRRSLNKYSSCSFGKFR